MSESTYWSQLQRRRIGRRAVLATGAAGAGALALGVAGCGDDDGGGKSAGGTPLGTEGAAGAQPKRGGTLQFNIITGYNTLDPHQNALLSFRDGGPGMAWSRLLKLKTGADLPPGTSTPVGDLAESWEQPDDQTTIFRLRKGVKFHNKPPLNGREFKAEDVVYSFTRQRDLKINAASLGQAETWTATDPYSVTIRTRIPDADFLRGMTDPKNNIIARETVELKGDLKEGPVLGTGPWIFEQWVPESHVLLSRNPDYFVQGIPYVDSARFLFIADPSVTRAAFRNRQVFVFSSSSGGSKEDIAALQRDFPDVTVFETRDNWGATAIAMNVDLSPMSDIRVRQGIVKAINRQQIVDSVGIGWLGTGVPVPSLDWVLPPAEVNKIIGYDVAAAKALLAQAGVSNLRLRSLVFNRPEYIAPAELVQASLKAVGIELALEPVDGAGWVARGNNNMDREVSIGPAVAVRESTTAFLLTVFHSRGPRNGQHVKDPQLDRLIEQQGTILRDVEARKRVVMDIQRRILELAVNVPIYTTAGKIAAWSFVKNYTIANSDYSRYDVMWLDR